MRFTHLALITLALACASALAGGETNAIKFRLGFSSASVADVNENDARAAMKVWAQMLFNERSLPVEAEPIILKDLPGISEALRSKSIDAIVLNVDECWQLDNSLRSDTFISGLNDGRTSERYVLLVKADSHFERLEDLRGHTLALLHTARTCLAPIWLDTLLAKATQPPVASFFKVNLTTKLSKAVLPVFFGQTDACLVTERGFGTMGELNPQVKQHLRILVISPDYVPTGFCFRKDYDGPVKEAIMANVPRIKDSPAGAQVLNLFQSDSLQAQPISCLDNAFDLLQEHSQLEPMGNSKVPPAETKPKGAATP